MAEKEAKKYLRTRAIVAMHIIVRNKSLTDSSFYETYGRRPSMIVALYNTLKSNEPELVGKIEEELNNSHDELEKTLAALKKFGETSKKNSVNGAIGAKVRKERKNMEEPEEPEEP